MGFFLNFKLEYEIIEEKTVIITELVEVLEKVCRSSRHGQNVTYRSSDEKKELEELSKGYKVKGRVDASNFGSNNC